jgi:hypothetical protein
MDDELGRVAADMVRSGTMATARGLLEAGAPLLVDKFGAEVAAQCSTPEWMTDLLFAKQTIEEQRHSFAASMLLLAGGEPACWHADRTAGLQRLFDELEDLMCVVPQTRGHLRGGPNQLVDSSVWYRSELYAFKVEPARAALEEVKPFQALRPHDLPVDTRATLCSSIGYPTVPHTGSA